MGYRTDISDREWEIIAKDFAPYRTGRKRDHNIEEVINAIPYQQKTGCQWDLLPNDFPPHKAVKYYFYNWRDSGFWEDLQQKLHKKLREALNREAEPSLGIMDAQSVKTVQKGGLGAMTRARKLRVENVRL